jgi:hypothetical protein
MKPQLALLTVSIGVQPTGLSLLPQPSLSLVTCNIAASPTKAIRSVVYLAASIAQSNNSSDRSSSPTRFEICLSPALQLPSTLQAIAPPPQDIKTHKREGFICKTLPLAIAIPLNAAIAFQG